MASPLAPPGGSILITSAPQSASCRTQVGPARWAVRSRTVTPCSGRIMGRLSGWGSVRGRPRGVGLVPDLVEDLTLEHDEIGIGDQVDGRSEEPTSELQSLISISYPVFFL